MSVSWTYAGSYAGAQSRSSSIDYYSSLMVIIMIMNSNSYSGNKSLVSSTALLVAGSCLTCLVVETQSFVVEKTLTCVVVPL